MDLNICLYCEKPLSEEGMSFCSLTCQDHEASKNASYNYSVYYHHSLSAHHQRKNTSNQAAVMIQSTPRHPSMPLTAPPQEIMSYHRRRSFFYSKDYPTQRRPSSSMIAGTHYDTSSDCSLSSIAAADGCYSLYNTHILDNTSSISTVSYESSDMDSVNTIL